MSKPKQTDPQLKVRLPQETKEWLGKQADTNGRSLSAEVAFRLSKARQEEQEKADELKRS